MINHLKRIYESEYSPPYPDYKPDYDITPINDPYPYTDVKISVNTFDNSIQPVKVKVYNAGGGRLTVERISIPHAHSKWVERRKRPKPIILTPSSNPLEIELNILLRGLPNPTNKNIAKLKLISKPQRKNFTDITLEVYPVEDQSTNLTLPEYINFGEIVSYKVSIADKRENKETQSTEFLLIGDFTLFPATRLEITQKNESTFDANILSQKGELQYTLDLQNPGVVLPRQKKTGTILKSFQKTIPISIVSQQQLSEYQITSETDWLIAPTKIQITNYGTTELPVSVNIQKLKQGRNVGILRVADKNISVWVWYKIVNETTVMLDKDQPDLHHVEEFPKQEKLLPISVESEEESYQPVMIFEDVEFQFPRTDEERVGYLIGSLNDWTPRTLFFEKRVDGFGITISLSEGTYLYRADIDGEMRLDPTRLYEIVCCKHGIASKIEIERVEQKITLRNRSKQKLEIKLKSATNWLRIKPETLVLPPRKKSEISAVIRSEHLLPGLNLGWIQLESEKEPIRSLNVPIYVKGLTNGPVPVVQNDELTFPDMEQGNPESISLPLKIFGEGELKGEVQPSTVLRFTDGNLQIQNENAFEPKEIEKLVQVVTDRPSNAYRKHIQASLITDCYLANRRVRRFKANYDMIHLVTDPPALYFPKVYLFDKPKQTDLVVKRSDGKEIEECHVKIPDEIEQTGLLKVENTDAHCRFELNPQVATDAGRISNTIHLMDHKSDMTLPIQFAAELVGGKSKIHVDTESQNTNQSSNGPQLVVTNIGKTELKIFDIDFKMSRFYIEPYFTTEQWILLPGQSIERQISIKNTIGSFGKSKVKDTIIIKLNDPQYPKGVYEKDIVVENQKRLLKFRR